MIEKYGLVKGEQLRKADGQLIRSDIYFCKDESGKKFLAKIFQAQDENARKRFVKEVKVIRKLRSSSKRYKKWFPKICWYSLKGKHPYYIYEYVEGEPIGRFVDDFGIKWGYFGHKNFNEFIKFFDFVAKSDVGINEENLSNWGARLAMKEIQFYFENCPDLLSENLYGEVRNFLEKKKSKAFSQRELSHTDLYPENMLIKERQTSTFTFLDWEYFGYVPIGFNPAFLYLLFWREEYWQARILSHFHNKYENENRDKGLKAFYMSFRFCLVVLGIRFLYQLVTYGDKSSDDFNNAKMSFLSVIESAIAGEITRPKNIKFLVGKDDIQKVCSDYGLGEVSKYYVFYASKGNTVIKTHAEKGTYILRFYSISRSKSLINRELKIFKHLRDMGVKTYDVVPNPSGDLYSTYKMYGRRRKVAVLTYVRGKKIKKEWAKRKAAIEAGRQLRKIHDAGVVHGDYSKENVLFIKDRVSGVIDFEWGRFTSSRKAHRSDLAKAVALWIVDIRRKGMPNRDFILAFLEGYLGKKPTTRFLRGFVDLTIQKIEEERAIFLTQIDKKRTKNPKIGRRFDSAIKILKELV